MFESWNYYNKCFVPFIRLWSIKRKLVRRKPNGRGVKRIGNDSGYLERRRFRNQKYLCRAGRVSRRGEYSQSKGEITIEGSTSVATLMEELAERLMNKTSHLLEYAGQVNDAYQAKADAQLLTTEHLQKGKNL